MPAPALMSITTSSLYRRIRLSLANTGLVTAPHRPSRIACTPLMPMVKTIANLSDYHPYGWYGDKYLLVTKNSTELYIMDVKGLPTGQAGGAPVEITDFQPSGGQIVRG